VKTLNMQAEHNKTQSFVQKAVAVTHKQAFAQKSIAPKSMVKYASHVVKSAALGKPTAAQQPTSLSKQ